MTIFYDLRNCKQHVKRYGKFIIILLFFGCTASPEWAEGGYSNGSREIKVIFKKPTPYLKEFPISKTGKITLNNPRISYGDYNDLSFFEPEVGLDTLAITSEKPFVILNHTVGFNYDHNFILKTGHTYFMEYNGEFPYLVDKSDDLFINVDSLTNSDFIGKVSNPLSSFFRELTFQYLLRPNEREITLKEAYLKAKNHLVREKHIVDSLYKIEQISAFTYEYFNQRNSASFYKNELNGNIKVPYVSLKDGLNKLTIESKYKDQLLQEVCKKYIYPQIKQIEYQDGINRDYTELFFSLDTCGIFNNSDKKYLLSQMLDFTEKNSEKEYERLAGVFFDRFKENHSKEVRDLAASNLKGNFSKSSDLLRSINGESSLLKDLIQKGDSKLYYVDLWASWCGPCRAEIPTSLELRKEYEKKSITFLYISIDENEKNWKRALIAEKMENIPENFIFPFFEESSLRQKFNVSSIPRYLLFNNKGAIIDDNAPRPSAPKVNQYFEKHLAEN